MILPSHTLPRIAVLILLVVGVPTVYIAISMKVASAHPRTGRVLVAVFLSLGYGFIATIVASIFLGSHVGAILYAPLVLISSPKAWKDAKGAMTIDDAPIPPR